MSPTFTFCSFLNTEFKVGTAWFSRKISRTTCLTKAHSFSSTFIFRASDIATPEWFSHCTTSSFVLIKETVFRIFHVTSAVLSTTWWNFILFFCACSCSKYLLTRNMIAACDLLYFRRRLWGLCLILLIGSHVTNVGGLVSENQYQFSFPIVYYLFFIAVV